MNNGLSSKINTLCRVVNSPGSKGLRSELRRSGAKAPGTAFWRLAVQYIDPDGTELHPENEDRIHRWQAILWALALMGPKHRPSCALGKAMAAAGVSESRLTRLMRASPEQLHGEIRHTLSQVLSAGEYVDGVDLAYLILTAGKPGEERVRNRIARDYYRSTPLKKG